MSANVSVFLFEPRDDRRGVYADALRSAGLDVQTISTLPSDSDESPIPRVIVGSFDASTRAHLVEFCHSLKGECRARTTVVFLASTDMEEDDLRLATEVGALVLKVPPFDTPKLVAAIQGVVAAEHRQPLRASLKPPDDISRLA